MSISTKSSGLWAGSVALLALAVAVAGYFDAHRLARVNAAESAASPAPAVPRTIVLPAQTKVVVRLDETISSRSRAGSEFAATVTEPVFVNGEDVIARGARATVRVVDAKQSGHLKGVAHLSLGLDSVEKGGRSYPVETNLYSVRGKNHKKRNLISIGSGAGTGALIGGLAGGPVGALIGTGAGAGAGTTYAAVTGKKSVAVAAETRITFALREPAQITMQ
jgi:hypothetical protein